MAKYIIRLDDICENMNWDNYCKLIANKDIISFNENSKYSINGNNYKIQKFLLKNSILFLRKLRSIRGNK